ncbi:hypothetical protein OX283_009250 [Flavobacterium sp. SUN052]|uniref:hypothetical protein n=1 Tax=Flavobacterium sp. SUN052 TaxID=3002441 RepID=UPI00237DA2F0|nr:hypothetical protein [Flavobacterium sp. SUN052]MEC4004839.1 hypothetical protein [Flavobacterium sp. SUN052]
MKNFDAFVEHIVTKWRAEKHFLLEKGGQLGMPSNREAGDLSEQYVVSRIGKLPTKYATYFSKGSQTPSDIYSVGRRNGYWHIMLIQVKSSRNKNAIHKLDEVEIKGLEVLAKFIKSEIESGLILKDYKDKEIIITTGYAGVYSNHTLNPSRHYLMDTKYYKMFRMNSGNLDLSSVKNSVIVTHEL